jgi:hypothetical protein
MNFFIFPPFPVCPSSVVKPTNVYADEMFGFNIDRNSSITVELCLLYRLCQVIIISRLEMRIRTMQMGIRVFAATDKKV